MGLAFYASPQILQTRYLCHFLTQGAVCTFNKRHIPGVADSGSFILEKPGRKLPDNSSSSKFGTIFLPFVALPSESSHRLCTRVAETRKKLPRVVC